MAQSPLKAAAETASDTVKKTAQAAEDALAGSEAERLKGQIADLQADISRILKSLADLGTAQGAALAEGLKHGADTLHAKGEAAAARVKAKGEAAAAQAEEGLEEARSYVRANPFTALGLAAGAGLIFGLLVGRR